MKARPYSRGPRPVVARHWGCFRPYGYACRECDRFDKAMAPQPPKKPKPGPTKGE